MIDWTGPAGRTIVSLTFIAVLELVCIVYLMVRTPCLS